MPSSGCVQTSTFTVAKRMPAKPLPGSSEKRPRITENDSLVALSFWHGKCFQNDDFVQVFRKCESTVNLFVCLNIGSQKLSEHLCLVPSHGYLNSLIHHDGVGVEKPIHLPDKITFTATGSGAVTFFEFLNDTSVRAKKEKIITAKLSKTWKSADLDAMLAIRLVNLVIKYSPTHDVGGPVDAAILTMGRTVHWIQRKSICENNY